MKSGREGGATAPTHTRAGFIKNKDSRRADERKRDREFAAIPAAQRAGRLGRVRAEIEMRGQPRDLGLECFSRKTSQRAIEAQVLQRAQLGVEHIKLRTDAHRRADS